MFQVNSVGVQMGSATCTFTWVIWAQGAGNTVMRLSLGNRSPGERKRGESVTPRAGVFRRGTRPRQLVPRQLVPRHPLRPQPQLIPQTRLQLPPPHQITLAGYMITHTTDIDVLILPRISGSGRRSYPLAIPYKAPHRALASGSRIVYDAIMRRSLEDWSS